MKTLEINGAYDEMQDLFRPHIAAITHVSVVGCYSTVTRPLHVRYVRYTPAEAQTVASVPLCFYVLPAFLPSLPG